MSWWTRKACVATEALKARKEAEQGTKEAQALLAEIRQTVPWLQEIRESDHFAESVRLSLGGTKRAE